LKMERKKFLLNEVTPTPKLGRSLPLDAYLKYAAVILFGNCFWFLVSPFNDSTRPTQELGKTKR